MEKNPYNRLLRETEQARGMTRRKFVSLLGAAAAASLLPYLKWADASEWPARAAPPSMEAAPNAYSDWEESYFRYISGMFILNQNPPYFTVGQKGSMARPVLDRFHRGLNEIARDPFPVYLEPSATTRGKIASGYEGQVGILHFSVYTFFEMECITDLQIGFRR